MCEPVSLGLLAASVAMTAGSAVVQHRAQNEAYASNKAAAEAAYSNDLAMIQLRQKQEDDALQSRQLDEARTGLQRRGTLTAAVGTTSGLSVSELLNEYDRNTAERQQSLLYNRNAGALQGAFDVQAAAIQKQSRINSVSRANTLGSLLTFGGGVLPAAERFAERQGAFERSPTRFTRTGN